MAIYSLIDVVLALRNQYVERQKMLNKMRSYIRIKNNKVTDCVFLEHQKKLEKYIELQLVKNESALTRLYNLVNKANKPDIPDKKIIQIAYEENLEKRFIIVPNTNDYEITSLNGLYVYADKMMDSPFYNRIKAKIETPDKTTAMEFGLNGININTKETPESISTSIRYEANTDQILFTPHNEKFYSDQFLGLFDAKIPEEVLPEYHRKAVEDSISEGRLLKVVDYKYSTNTQKFNIEINDNAVVLKGITKENSKKEKVKVKKEAINK